MRIDQNLPSAKSAADATGKVFEDKYDPFNSNKSPDYSPVQKQAAAEKPPVAGVTRQPTEDGNVYSEYRDKWNSLPVKEWSLPGHEGSGKENWGKVKIDDANIPTKTIDYTSSRRML